MIQDIKSGEKCVFGGGGGGQVILLVVSMGGVKNIYIFFGGEGSSKIWVMNQDLSRHTPMTLK